MLHVTPQLFALTETGDLEDLKAALQNAMALEHATMPPYLYALYSLSGNAAVNPRIKGALRTIVREEMLHMMLAGNLLKAIGGKPVIYSADFVPRYPGPLPGIATDLIVPLKRFSRELARDVFMRIEEPATPLEFRVQAAGMGPTAEERPRTIGEFYARIRQIFQERPELIQVTNGQPSTDRFAAYPVKQTIESSEDAVMAIDFIVEQGEGTTKDPYFRDGDDDPVDDMLAHYYRFAEIVRGKLKRNPAPPADPAPQDLYIYDAEDAVPFDEARVLALRDNPRADDFAEGSPVRQKMDECNLIYTEMLRGLDDAFNVNPGRMGEAIGKMTELRTAVGGLMSMELGDGTRPGPSFEFLEP